MKNHLQIGFIVLLVSFAVIVSGCGPEPNPKLQGKAAQPEQQAPPAVEKPAPLVEPPPAPVEEPRPQSVAKPDKKPVVKAAPARETARTYPSVPARPAPATPAPAPPSSSPAASSTASNAPGTLTLPAPIAPPIAIPEPPRDEVRPARVEPPPPRKVVVPSGTLVGIRMIDSVDSSTAHEGDTFKASLDTAIKVDNETVFPVGTDIYVKLAKVESAGRVSGKSELQLELDHILLGRKSYSLESNKYVQTGASQAGRTAKSAGVGAAIGAAIGAIAGGGKGAVIGGATGAGAGAGVEAVRKGEAVRVDSEARLDFRLEDSLEVTLDSASSSPQRNNPSGPNRFGTRQ